MSDKDIEETCKKILKHELKASEYMDVLMEEDVEEVEDAMSNVVERLLEKMDGGKREIRLYHLMAQIGQTVGSEKMMIFGQRKIEEVTNTNGKQ